MPFRLLREPPCTKKELTEEAKKICGQHYWSAQRVHSELMVSFMELFIGPLVITFLLAGFIKLFILLNMTNQINISWCFVNIFVLSLIGTAIIFLLVLYKKWFTVLCLGNIKLKFYSLDLDQKKSENIKHILNKYIQNEWDY